MNDDNTVLELLEAAKAFRSRVVECEQHPSMVAVYQMASIHGSGYRGPTWVDELRRLDDAISHAEGRS